ncbi:MAG TPA: glycosyltransferase [Flavobacteriales bacterium]|nr:glycosyltransferase [Flavobacteriales bacterium]
MNVLYLSYDGLTDGLGRSQVLPYIFGLQQKGHTFTIVSFEKSVNFQKEESTIQKLVDDAKIKWVPLKYTSSPPVLSTIYDVYLLRKMVEQLHNEFPFHIIHCRSYITSLIGLQMQKKHNVKFVFDMRAFYADERVDGKLWNLNNPIFKTVYDYFKRKEIEFLGNADYSISLTKKGKDIIHSWAKVQNQPVPVEVIPCCADLNHFHPSRVNASRQTELKKQFGLTEDDFVITYLGSIGTWYLLDEMLDFFKILIQKRPNSKFLFVTTDNPNTILPAAKSKGVPSDRIIISPAKREEVPTFLSLANAAIFFIQPVFSKSGSSPTKHGEMLGMGLPVIANSGVGDVDRIIEDTKSGILVREFTNEAYEKAVSQIDELLNIPVSTLQNAAHKYYSLEEGVKRYSSVYERICSQ